MARDLTNKVIIITGASSGIGAATALQCAQAGMDMVLNARRVEKLQQVAQRVKQTGRRAILVEADVADPGTTQLLLDSAESEFGRFDVVFANAGYGFEKAMHDVSDDELRRIFDVNFFAAFDLLRESANRLLNQQRCGHLLMCSSCLAKFTLPYYGAYAATKAAQSHLCRAMGVELKPDGIDVSCVHPITTVTEFFEVSAKLSGQVPRTATVPEHSPKMFVQPAERVAKAVVRCLHRPKAEVWTSHIVRTVAGLMTIAPWFMDLVMRTEAKKRREALQKHP